MGKLKKYTQEQLDFICSYAPGHWIKEIQQAYFDKFGIRIDSSPVRCILTRFKIRTNAKTVRGMREVNSAHRLTTFEQDKIIREKWHECGHGSYAELQAFMQTEFGLNLTIKQVKSYMSRTHIRFGTYGYFPPGHEPVNKGRKMTKEHYDKCAATMFKKGSRPANWKPVGSERVTVDGYVEVKIAEPKKWALKHRLIWEQATGQKIKKGEVVVFLDQNRLNFDLDNLVLIKQSELSRLNQLHLLGSDQERSRVGVTLAKLMTAKSEAQRRSKND